MANPHANPTKARLAKKSARKPGDLQALRHADADLTLRVYGRTRDTALTARVDAVAVMLGLQPVGVTVVSSVRAAVGRNEVQSINTKGGTGTGNDAVEEGMVPWVSKSLTTGAKMEKV